MAILTGINLSGVYQLDGGPVVSLTTYQLLDSDFICGTVFADASLSDIIMTRDDFVDLLKLAKSLFAAISHIQSTRITGLPDIPVDLSMTITAPGIVYTIAMGDLDVSVTWDIAQQQLTIGTFLAFTISFDAYVYFIDSLHDLAVEIDKL